MPSVSVAPCLPFLVMSHHCLLLTVISFQSFLLPVISLPCSTLSMAPPLLTNKYKLSRSSQSPTYLFLLFPQLCCRHPSVPLTIAPNHPVHCEAVLRTEMHPSSSVCQSTPIPQGPDETFSLQTSHFPVNAYLHTLNRQWAPCGQLLITLWWSGIQ